MIIIIQLLNNTINLKNNTDSKNQNNIKNEVKYN